MNDPGSSPHHRWNVRRVTVLAVVVNVLVHLWFITAELLGESGDSLMERARIYTDEIPAPVNVWSTGFHLPAWLAAALTLSGIEDRASPMAFVLPQLAFLAVSSAQVALVAVGLFRLWSWGGKWLRRRLTGAGG